MELGKVIFSDLLNSRFEELVFILFQKKYFSSQSNANPLGVIIYSKIN